ncbi:MAG TPA: FmdB family zinc ribbon protein [Micromonosporaceae bacterium]|nr:FmdB family zinc ribbon protein [Micromonosporaceae bacterium]
MPTYQYACTACDHQLEAVQSFTDEPLTECPACQGRLRKLFNSVGIVFKGSGFYRTDSRAGSAGSSNESTNGAKNKTESSGSTSAATGTSGSTGSSGSNGSASKSKTTSTSGSGTSA